MSYAHLHCLITSQLSFHLTNMNSAFHFCTIFCPLSCLDTIFFLLFFCSSRSFFLLITILLLLSPPSSRSLLEVQQFVRVPNVIISIFPSLSTRSLLYTQWFSLNSTDSRSNSSAGQHFVWRICLCSKNGLQKSCLCCMQSWRLMCKRHNHQ